MELLNQYGDTAIKAGKGHGVDIASQRADDLDLACIDYLQKLTQSGKPVIAADVACGMAGQALRMAQAGAIVECLDIVDQFEQAKDLASKQNFSIAFSVGSMEDSPQYLSSNLDAVICQRAIHYLPYIQAVKTLINLRTLLKPGAKLFISASGIDSELGQNYRGRNDAVQQRFTALDEPMASKHNIHGPVCLYNEDELKDLLVETGYVVESVFKSSFGNVKAIAKVGV